MKSLSRIAAGLLLAVGLAVVVLLRSPSVTLADVVGKVAGAGSLTYTLTATNLETKESFAVKYMVLGDGRQRSEMPNGLVSVLDPRAGKTLLLNPKEKTAVVGEFKGAAMPDPIEQFRRMGGKGAKELGEKEIGGRRVKGFVTTSEGPEFTVWADPATGDPVQVETTLRVSGGTSRFVMSDFVVDAKLDESLFGLGVPEGYRQANQEGVRVATVVAQQGGLEDHVVGALGGYARLAGGKLPAKLDDWSAYAKLSADGPVKDEVFRLMGHVGALTPFLVTLPKDGWAYLGEGKRLGDKEAVVFWYRKKDGTYRAVYGDMRVEDVKKEALPGR